MDILHYCIENSGKSITRGWVDSFLGRNLTLLMETTSTPQEDFRLQVPREVLEETLRCMEEVVQDIVRDLVFNLDEVGVSEWEDRKPKRVVISTSVIGQTIHHGVNRNPKHVTIVTCVAASGEHLIPYLITPQDSPALHDDLERHGIEFDRHLTIKGRQKRS
jgi:hypothetical protein